MPGPMWTAHTLALASDAGCCSSCHHSGPSSSLGPRPENSPEATRQPRGPWSLWQKQPLLPCPALRLRVGPPTVVPRLCPAPHCKMDAVICPERRAEGENQRTSIKCQRLVSTGDTSEDTHLTKAALFFGSFSQVACEVSRRASSSERLSAAPWVAQPGLDCKASSAGGQAPRPELSSSPGCGATQSPHRPGRASGFAVVALTGSQGKG